MKMQNEHELLYNVLSSTQQPRITPSHDFEELDMYLHGNACMNNLNLIYTENTHSKIPMCTRGISISHP